MACIHFKFKNSLDYDSITFDGLHIALKDLKRMIMSRKKLRDTDDDLQIINAITKKAYSNDDEMIPKNSSVIVARIPVTNAAPRNGPKTLNHPNAYKEDPKPVRKAIEVPVSKTQDPLETGNLIESNASEEDKIKEMMRQSTMEFDPSNYINNKKAPTGTPSSTYICKKCGKSGHFIQNCPVEPGEAFDKEKLAKRPTGIPHSFLTPVRDPNAQGALLIGPGQYGVPTIDMNAYMEKKKERPPFLPEEKLPEPKKEEIPAELLCPLCKDLLTDAVLIPCCGTSFCDDCIRNELLESDDHECPQCHETEKSPDSLIANKSLRSAVTNYRNETGYTKVTKAMMKAKQEKMEASKAARRAEKDKHKAHTHSRSSEKNVAAQAIPTYGMKAGQHYKVGGFHVGRSPGSPSKVAPKYNDSQSTSESAAGTKPLLTLSTPTPSSVPRGLSPPTPCKDEKDVPHPGSSAPVSIQSTSMSSQPVSSAAALTSHPPPSTQPMGTRNPVIPPGFPAAPIQPVGVPYRPPMPILNPAIPPPGFVGPPPTGPFGVGTRFPTAPAVIPPFQTAPPPPVPLSKEEFYRQKKKLLEQEKKKKADPLDVFAREFMDYKKKPKSASKSRSRSRSKTPRRSITPRRSRTRSKSRSLTPRKRSRSLTPRKRSRSLTPRKRAFGSRSRTRSHSRSPKRSRSPFMKPTYRSRSRTRSPRSRSRTPPRYRSRSRSFSPRYRSRSPRPRSYSRSPVRYRSRSPPPRWRSRSRSPGRYDRWSPPPYGRRRSRSPPPPLYRGRSRSPPPYDYYRPDWDAPPPPMYGDYRGPPGRPGGRGPPPPHYQYPPDPYNRFDPRAYDEFYHEFYSRYGMPPPPPPAANSGGLYDAPPYPPRRSRSPRERRPYKERPPPRNKNEDIKSNRADKKAGEKKSEKKSSKSGSKKEEEKEKGSKKKKNEKTSNKEKDEENKTAEKKENGEEKKKENGEEKKDEGKDGHSKKRKKVSSKTSKKEAVQGDGKEEKNDVKVEDQKTAKPNEEKDKKDNTKPENSTGEDGFKKDMKEVEDKNIRREKDEEKESEGKIKAKKSSVNRESSEKLDNVKSCEEEIKPLKEESSKEGERKGKRKHKKVVRETVKDKKLMEEDEAEESPAKRQKTDTVSDGGDQIMLSPPILSKWEKEDYHDDVSPRRSRKPSPESRPSKQERKMLPRSVIEKAEKALALKQPQPISVASSIKPSSNLASRLEKSPPPKLKSPEGKSRRVYVENDSNKKTEEDSRKVLSRDRSMQITVSSDVKSKSKSKDSKKEVKDLRESLLEKRRASTRSSTEELEQSRGKGFNHDDRLTNSNYSREKDWDYIDDERNGDGWLSKKVKVSSKASKSHGNNGEERRSVSKEKIEKARKSKEDKESPKRSKKEEEKEGKNVKKASKSQEQREDKKKREDTGSNRESTVKLTEKVEHTEKIEGEKTAGTKHHMRTDRKESLFDESTFVPDYNEAMGSESEEDTPKQELQRQYSTAESEKLDSESEEETSGEEKEKKHKKKKSKHKKNKKKHKKHKKKHKKQDVAMDDSS